MVTVENTGTDLILLFLLVVSCHVGLAANVQKTSSENWSNHNGLAALSNVGPPAMSWKANLMQRDARVNSAATSQDTFQAKYGNSHGSDTRSTLMKDSAAKQSMVKDSVAALQQFKSYSKDSAFSPYVVDVYKKVHNNLEHKNYLSASHSAPEAAERDELALKRDVASDQALHSMATAGEDINGALHDHVHSMALLLNTYGNEADTKNLQADYAAPNMVKAGQNGLAGFVGYQSQADNLPYTDQDQYRTRSPRMNPLCNPCGPPPCPPCPPLPPPPAPPVPCVTEIPLCIQYLINLVVIILGLGILKWYCSAMAELDRECGLDDRASGGHDRALGLKKSSFSPPMATISAYYDPATNQVLLPHEHKHYQFTH